MTQSAQAGDGLMGIDAVGPATIGDDFGGAVQSRRHCIQSAQIDLYGAGNVTHGEFIFRPHIQQSDRTLLQPRGKFSAGDRLGCNAIG